ncbi:MAG: sugar ABC transporter ATP-binding protein [Chitinispirillaceae bacterium]|nr:sugar ABC transporter ATP-binding protein [Chitinispirillaceae bacterium]
MSCLLEMRGIVKEYPGVRALKGVDFDLNPAEVHAIAGENGAGKSTLIKILGGACRRNAGSIRIDGVEVDIDTPRSAEKCGISIIYQEFNLIRSLSVAENIFLGREPRRGVFLDKKKLNEEARAILDRLQVPLDIEERIGTLSVAQQQMVEIAHAISINARIMVMDEPSATLTGHELENLFHLIALLKAQGTGIVYISHRLEEIIRIADRVTVLRDGAHIITRTRNEYNRELLIKDMVGRELKDEFPSRTRVTGTELLRVDNLSRRGVLEAISFSLNYGEILGITGLVGSGRTELLRAIFGADRIDRGTVMIEGKTVRIRSPRNAIRNGIALAVEDRKLQGLVLGMSVSDNITLASLNAVNRFGFIDKKKACAAAALQIERLRIKTTGMLQRVGSLSGGNQQKVVLAKWLSARSKILLLDEPTRGIDVGAKQEIYLLINTLAAEGMGIIMVSSELPEVLGMSDRIFVMRGGALRAQFTRGEATQEKIMECAAN